ncbi:MAG TPA: hypothetical protein DDZ51_20975 [Planctomycetaceae bacterium]|nr:hypothetical protein [Planctomycetaceae bacterium]
MPCTRRRRGLMMQASVAISGVSSLPATAGIPTPAPMPEKPMLDVAPGCGAGYIDLVAFVRDFQPG